MSKIASLDVKNVDDEKTSTKIREQYQYGTELSMKDGTYKELVQLAKEIITKTKEILNK